jgi:hypothetical protein
MKKVILVMVIALTGLVSVNAQYYVGGSLGFNSSSNKLKEGNKNTSTSFTIAPEFGYNLSDKIDLGISLGFINTQMDEYSRELKQNIWEIAPYVRYSILQYGKFSILAKAELAIAGGKIDITYKEYAYEENNDYNQKYTHFGIGIRPILTYSLSDKIVLLSELNFFNIGFYSSDYKDSHTSTGFSLGANTDNILNVGDVTIGFAYKF